MDIRLIGPGHQGYYGKKNYNEIYTIGGGQKKKSLESNGFCLNLTHKYTLFRNLKKRARPHCQPTLILEISLRAALSNPFSMRGNHNWRSTPSTTSKTVTCKLSWEHLQKVQILLASGGDFWNRVWTNPAWQPALYKNTSMPEKSGKLHLKWYTMMSEILERGTRDVMSLSSVWNPGWSHIHKATYTN